MIRVVLSSPELLEAEAILRSVSDELEAVTPVEKRLGVVAGSAILERLRSVGSLPVGGAVITPGGDLSAAFFIHVVILSRDEPVTAPGVGRALVNGLRRAAEWGVERLVLPPLGTGVGNLDAETAAQVMADTLREHMVVTEFPAEVVVAVANEYEEDAFRREVERVQRRG